MATLTCPGCGTEIRPQPHRCKRCRARFEAIAPPTRCPSCKSAYWMHARGTLKRGRPPKAQA